MRLFKFILFTVLFASCKFNKKPLCDKLHRGTYLYYPKDTGGKLLIERKDSTQTEKHSISGQITKYKITWTECIYTMVLLETNSKLHENMKPEDYVFRYEVIKQTDRYYVFKELSGMFENSIQIDTIWIK